MQLSLKHSDRIEGLSVVVLQTCAINSGRIRPLFILLGVESTFRVAGWAILWQLSQITNKHSKSVFKLKLKSRVIQASCFALFSAFIENDPISFPEYACSQVM
jgi:hypothetical protein